MIFGWLICKVKGKHKRGKIQRDEMFGDKSVVRTYACPRCGATWTRKVRNATA
jgi:hypothetical protein